MSRLWLLLGVTWTVRILAETYDTYPKATATSEFPQLRAAGSTSVAILYSTEEEVIILVTHASLLHVPSSYVATNIVLSSLRSSSPRADVIVDALTVKIGNRRRVTPGVLGL